MREALSALRRVWDSCDAAEWVGHERMQLTAAEQIPFETFRALEAADIFVEFRTAAIQTAYDGPRSGVADSGVEFQLRVPRNARKLVVVEAIADLLAMPVLQQSQPTAYVLLSSKSPLGFFSHCSGDNLETAPVCVRRYHCALQLWHVLKGQADHVDETTGALLFFGPRRTVVAPGFGEADLGADLATEQIREFVDDPDRQSVRREIFSAVLSEFLRDTSEANAFRFLLRDSFRLARRLREGLAIYLAENSAEKLLEQVRRTSLEFSEKLEKVITGLETKSLTVPVALLLAVKDLQPGMGLTSLNLIFLCSALIYAGTMTLVHRSQIALLDVFNATITEAKNGFSRKGLESDNPVLTEAFIGLVTRSRAARNGSYLMCTASWVPFLSVLAAILV